VRKTPLTIDASLGEVVARLHQSRSLVLVAPPGAGKTTRVPIAIVESGLLGSEHPALVLLQPRRVAARAAAERMAEENGWTLGEEVGYQVRFDRRVGPRTKVRVATEGILNRQLIADPFLTGVGAVILDEFHERSLHTDLALALLREVREAVRNDLLLVVMSATLDAEPVAEFLGRCPILHVEGTSHPVEVRYRPTTRSASPDAIVEAVSESVAAGDVLVFLPGAEEIRRAGQRLAPLAEREGLVVLPLHGSLADEDQRRALRPSERRKVVLATNIAETSLTIDGIRTVIDSGLARFASVDPGRGLDRLELGRISRASATQRAGRAGRTGPGRCVRLWSEREHRGLRESDVPEVQRVDLCATVLALHSWGQADPGRFGWFEPPPRERLEAADRLLAMLGALDAVGGRITPLGRRLLALPLHPRLGRLVIAAAGDGFLRVGAALAALLSEKELVAPATYNGRPPVAGRGASDLLDRLDLLAAAERARFSAGLRDRGIQPSAARRVAQVRDDLIRTGTRLLGPAAELGGEYPEDQALRWILLAYPDRVARRRGREATGVMVGGRGVRLAPESVVREAEFFVALDPYEDRRAGTLEARVRIASAIRAEWLEELFPEAVRREPAVWFDDERQRVVGGSTFWYRDLMLREDKHGAVDSADASRVLAEALRPRAQHLVLENDAARTWLARLDLLRRAMLEWDWPEFGEGTLVEVLSDACIGKRTVEDVERASLVPFFKSRLSPTLSRMMDEHAPESLPVPSGNRIRLVYEAGRSPVMAVRLQELFGLAETPRIAGGRVAVTLHLLGPNFRPVQITEDLRSFWSTTYFQVRKDLRARYPKHAWPDDPLTARAESKGGRKR
jgi:ATP-dependent helicase HrpB